MQAALATERLRDIMHVREGSMDLLGSAARGEMSATLGMTEIGVNATQESDAST